MKRLLSQRILVKTAIVFMSLCVAVIISEVALRITIPQSNEYYVWPPHLQRIFRPLPDVMPGVAGESRFITNSKGVRADELTSDYTYTILAVGGSTTECLYLDHEEAWPHLLQKNLNDNQSSYKVWVGNFGKSGLNTRDHIVELRYILKQYTNIDIIILLIGVNDLLYILGKDILYNQEFLKNSNDEHKLLLRAFSNVRDEPSQILKMIKEYIFLPRTVQDEAGKIYITWREHRRNAAAFRHTLPDLTSALEEYRRNIHTIIDLAQRKSIRVIFMTQPVLWTPNIPEQLNALLWLGGIGNFQKERGKEYYAVDALSTAMAMYNETLINTCHARQVECVDLASLLPKDTTVFYDDVHFNESGAKKVAEALTRYLIHDHPLGSK
jgi:lysophospholipase L1-like esterase